MLKKIFLQIVFCAVFAGTAFAQQIAVPRIELMPNKPSNYLMRNWKQVAADYDNFIFDASKTGTYLPFVSFSPNGINYPYVNNIRMRTYVGSNRNAGEAESINIIPAVVGATLVGVDKIDHFSTNWVVKIKDYFNLANGQNIYLNNYSTATGGDWWYETMPNLFFYQLYDLYPNADADFATQFISVADRWLGAVYTLGGQLYPWQTPNMNWGAINLITGATQTAHRQPEAAGAIAWLLHQAYIHTGNAKYLQGAELCLEFLNHWTANPSYELQLPYGTIAAARMNAELGTNYNIDKFLNWSFCAGQGTLRGWGTITGNWNGYEMSGVIGEANDNGNDYAFVMNGFQHAAALAPVVKYDKRYARAIGKWLLNLASASRFFYANVLPQTNQQPDSYAWAVAHDPAYCIPYEAIKQNWQGTQPRAMGDAQRNGWAATDLSLYSGSSVGYLASLIETTNVEGILQIDLNKTDFRGQKIYPNYLYYNPNSNAETVNLTLPSGSYRIYDAITETVILSNVSGVVSFSVPADGVRLLVVIPNSGTLQTDGRFYRVQDGGIVDYHKNNDYSTLFRIKSFSSDKILVNEAENIDFHCIVENADGAVSYQWYVNNAQVSGTTADFQWTAPSIFGDYQIKCTATNGSNSVESQSITVRVVASGLYSPQIESIFFSENLPFDISAATTVSAVTNLNADGTYLWSCSAGTLSSATAAAPVWTLPATAGIYTLTLKISNELGEDTKRVDVLVKNLSAISDNVIPLIWYPLNGDAHNDAQDNFHAVINNAVAVADQRGMANNAYSFANFSQYIYTPNSAALNIADKIAVSFWVKVDALHAAEQFIISHGSWEERWKVSVTPERHVRWTLKTNTGIADVDDPQTIGTGEFVHYAALYTGTALELYRNGVFAAVKPLSGNIAATSKDITIARKDRSTTDYAFKGAVDEVRIYNAELSPAFIETLPTLWANETGIKETANGSSLQFTIINDELLIINYELKGNENVRIFDVTGKLIYNSLLIINNSINVSDLQQGIYFFKINNKIAKFIKK